MKVTPEIVTELKDNEIFVFGSNESGIHGAGAAYMAVKAFGAVYGNGFGLQGKSFAIPTKDWNIETLPRKAILFYVNRFIDFVVLNPHLHFLITPIGCGLAGWTTEDIAPLFKHFTILDTPNVSLPESFIKHLTT